jgi:hypothetical protein
MLKAPEMTAVSNHNNTPPNEAMKQTSIKKEVPPFSGSVVSKSVNVNPLFFIALRKFIPSPENMQRPAIFSNQNLRKIP